jgi:GNAT superfamily N-acetyltransferase
MDRVRISGYRPGALGKITELHGTYYHRNWNFGLFFESKVARELSAFLDRFDESHDGFWVALVDEQIVGAIAIVGNRKDRTEARLRWFIVAPGRQGLGIGNLLINEAIEFCRRVNFRRVYLTTFVGLDPARHLYEKWGFTLRGETEDTTWGVTVREQLFELILR